MNHIKMRHQILKHNQGLDLSKNEQITRATYNGSDLIADLLKRPPSTEWWLPYLVQLQKISPRGRILELGCGVGRSTYYLRDAGNYRYVGIDFAGEALKEAKKNFYSDARFFQMNMRLLGFKNAAFDLFWAATALYHIQKKDIQGALAELWRVMKPGGVGFISMQKGRGERLDSFFGMGERHMAFYAHSEFAQLLRSAKFEILETEEDWRNYDPPKDYTVWLLFLVRAIE